MLAQKIEKETVGRAGPHPGRGAAVGLSLQGRAPADPAPPRPQQILNCALDDIEWFVARLQKAAEAFKQLNQRKKGKKKGKKAPAEGVLTLRARPPSEAEFVDCFQKTKLAINLLVSPAAPPSPPHLPLRPARSVCRPLTRSRPPAGQAAEAHPEPQRGRAPALPLRASGPGAGGWRVGTRRPGACPWLRGGAAGWAARVHLRAEGAVGWPVALQGGGGAGV